MIHGTILPSSAVADLITDQVHQLVVPALGWVDLRVLDFEGAPVPQWSCELRVASRVEVAPTDDEGRVSFKALVDVDATGTLTATHPAGGWVKPETIELRVMPPVDQPAGQRARLDNLGYVPVPMPGETIVEAEPSAWAIEEFQAEQGLVVDGVCGPETQATLVQAHGH